MANIMLTDSCNLRCPYCFANEFVGGGKNEISEEAFEKAARFILGDGKQSFVGLIGGEPLTHPKFKSFVQRLIRDDRVQRIQVYTNGILMDRFQDILIHPKVYLLINCNAPTDTGEVPFRKMCENLSALLDAGQTTDRVTLGINMYKPDFEYEYLLELLIKHQFHIVRVSCTVPNTEEERKEDPHAFFLRMKPRMLEFFHALMQHGITPTFDCNKIPSCLISKEEFDQFRLYMLNRQVRKTMLSSNIANPIVTCSPVIDIRQDLTAVRCFGLSEHTKQRIEDFSGITELENHYLRTIDAYACNTVYSQNCVDCHLRKVMKCTGGCLAYKLGPILELASIAEDKMRV